jgi:peptidoglycan/LPS O-acetylase OafA/YrhL
VEKKHFPVLDGLRGIAALAVLMMHIYSSFTIPMFTRAYLAVDFFFLLSGFVICYAYEEKLKHSLSVPNFMLIRGIRLYPLIFFGLVLGTFVALSKISGDEYAELGAAFALGMLVLPSPFFQRSGSESYYPLNVPTWSLFYEIVGNLLYALIVPALSRRNLVFLIALSGGCFVWTVLWCGTINVGASSNDFFYAFPKFSFSFLFGVLLFKIHRAGRVDGLRASFVVLSLFMITCFCLPSEWGIGPDFMFIFLAGPVVVLAAANSTTERSSGFCHWAGRISYPVYILQYPFIRVVGHFTRSHVPSTLQLYFLTASALGIILVSWIALRFVDEPVRKKLTQLLSGMLLETKPAN